jgi:3-methyladenine DNA glycosylase AlkD
MSASTTIKDVLRELAALEDPKMREANERRGDDHGVNLTHLRSLAKRLKTQHELALQMKQAPAQKQWAMNHCLAEIGIHHPELRTRAIRIGERLAVLIDYPASPGCTPPYAPIWIAEMVRRREETRGR